MALPSITRSITIAATNRYLDVSSPLGGSETVTLSLSTHGDIFSLMTAIQTGLQALGSDWASATVSLVTSSGTYGRITIDASSASGNVSLLWSSGANSANSVGATIGFNTSADDTGAKTYTSDYQHMYGWYAARYPARYGPLLPEAIGGDLRVALTGTAAKKVHVGYHYFYDVVLNELLPANALSADATGSDTNRDLETIWEYMSQGNTIRWREDASVSGTYYTFYMLEPMSLYDSMTRPHVDIETYNINLRFRQQES